MKIVGKSTRKPQKMNACIRPGNHPLQQLSLAEHDGRLVAYPDGDLGSAIRRLARADEPREQEGAACEEPAGDRDRDDECDRGGDARGRAQPGPAF